MKIVTIVGARPQFIKAAVVSRKLWEFCEETKMCIRDRYEELLMAEEGLESTPNELIYIGQPIDMDCRKFLRQLDNLIYVAEKNGNNIKKEIGKVCDTYSPQM